MSVLCVEFILFQISGCCLNWGELLSGCVVPGSWSLSLALKAKLTCGGLFKWTSSDFGLRGWSSMPGWYKVCQIGRSEQKVHLQLLLHLEFRVYVCLVHSCV